MRIAPTLQQIIHRIAPESRFQLEWGEWRRPLQVFLRKGSVDLEIHRQPLHQPHLRLLHHLRVQAYPHPLQLLSPRLGRHLKPAELPHPHHLQWLSDGVPRVTTPMIRRLGLLLLGWSLLGSASFGPHTSHHILADGCRRHFFFLLRRFCTIEYRRCQNHICRRSFRLYPPEETLWQSPTWASSHPACIPQEEEHVRTASFPRSF